LKNAEKGYPALGAWIFFFEVFPVTKAILPTWDLSAETRQDPTALANTGKNEKNKTQEQEPSERDGTVPNNPFRADYYYY
jgi:hypothetical protein